MNKSLYQFLLIITKIGNRAVRKTQAENRRKGLPNVYVRGGKIYFELPNGKLTTVNPLTA